MMFTKRRIIATVFLLLICVIACVYYFRNPQILSSKVLRSPIKGASDKLTYKSVDLPNGLKVLIIHNPTAETAAAALDVGVGWFFEPQEYPGLAHFLEHLLFMGTEKYPKEAEYLQFLSKHAGDRNAFTYLEHTVYYFSVHSNFFEPALDRFSQFFISPLFDSSCVERERNAVNSEYLLYLKNDNWRLGQVKRLLTDHSHPYHRFGIGTNETLFDKNGLNTRDVLIDFYGKHYSANLMRLVVYGKEPVETLLSYVTDKFKDVPCPSHNLDYSWKDINIRPSKYLGSITWVNSMMFVRRIELDWLIPDQKILYKSKPAAFLGSIIGNDSPGGLLSYLKNKGWALQLNAGISEHISGCDIFSVNVVLTMQGLSNYENVIATVFSYFNFLKSFPNLPLHLFSEFSQLAKQQFNYGNKQSPLALITPLASAMHFYDGVDILSGDHLVEFYDADSIKSLLFDCLLPEKVSVFVLANHESMKCDPTKDQPCSSDDLYIAFDQIEPWFGVEFTNYKFSEDFLNDLRLSKLPNVFHLPSPNRFISTNLTIYGEQKDPSGYPEEIIKDIWFKQDDTFMLPKGMVSLVISNLHPLSKEQYAKIMLWTSLLSDYLQSTLYPSIEAGIFYYILAYQHTINIVVFGYSEKLLLLLDEIITDGLLMKKWKPDPVLFSAKKPNFINTLQNQYLLPPFQQGGIFLSLLLSEITFGIGSVVENVEKLQYDDISSFDSIFPPSKINLHFNSLVLGNFKKKTIFDYFTNLSSKFTESGLNVTQSVDPYRLKIAKLPLSQVVVIEKQVQDPNSCVYVYFQIGVVRAELDIATAFLVNEILSTAFFDILRTQEQFGYVVQSSLRFEGNVIGVQFIVQSTVNPSIIYARIISFLAEMIENIEQHMTPDELSTHKSSIQHKLLIKPMNFFEEFQKFEQNIFLGENPHLSSELSDLLSDIDRSAVIMWMKRYLFNKDGRRVASIVLFGTSATETLTDFVNRIDSLQPPIVLNAMDEDNIHDWKTINDQYYVSK